MSIYSVEDRSLVSVRQLNFDCAVFASGFEQRSVHVPRLLERRRCAEVVVFGFEEMSRHAERESNDRYFEQTWTKPEIISGEDDQAVYQMLQRTLGAARRDEVRILVDYSSMSRVWYAAVLNWARYASQFARIKIVLVYSVGEHREAVPPMRIKEIISLPGCEGSSTPLFRSVALFGLGFDGLAPLCVLDRLEPDTVYAYLASPAPFKDYPLQARLHNRELIDVYAKQTFGLPLESVEQTFRHLAEIISPHRREADITAIPMGPKPHVLASILLSMRFEEVGCLRVSGRRSTNEAVAALGPVVATEVECRHTDPASDPMSDSAGG